jgi:hypothetical protein
MNPRIWFAIILIACVGGTACAKPAKKKGGGDNLPKLTIVTVSPSEITLEASKDAQMTYEITGQTKVTLGGVPITPDDLRAGMVANVDVAPDNRTALTIAAQKSPRVTKKPPPQTIWVVY